MLILIVGLLLGYFAYGNGERFSYHLGLDLSGGTHLLYRADTSSLQAEDVGDSMAALRDVIERRVNLFGVSEPVVQLESGNNEERLIVELPGVTDVEQAIALIGATPVLEFKIEAKEGSIEREKALEAEREIEAAFMEGREPDPIFLAAAEGFYQNTALTGRYLKRAQASFQQGAGLSQEPVVLLEFNEEGKDLFAEITSANVSKTVAIYLDGALLSAPVVQTPITDGNAIISGSFTPQDVRELAGRLNAGALPVPISLLSTQTIGPSLGREAIQGGMNAALIGIVLVIIFMLAWYRLPGVVSIFALSIYVVIMLSLFKIIPVTLTAAGIAGFILSVGMAVDANILIFERMKEELDRGHNLEESIREGFKRAWTSIRDSNISSIITATILFWFGSSLIQGFALTFGLGVLVSMFSAVTVSRTLLLALGMRRVDGAAGFFFGNGFRK